MVRYLNIFIYLCISVSFLSCRPSEKEGPIWQDIKVGDLAPLKNSKEDFLLKTINFDIYTFEIPQKNIGFLEEISLLLYTEPILFNDAAVFKANSFTLGFANMEQWDTIAELLNAAEGKKLEKITLILSANQTEIVKIKTFDSGKNISYVSSARQTETKTVGPGSIVLRIKAERIPGARGVCALNVKPEFIGTGHIQNQYSFTALSFNVRMSPGYFLFLAPDNYIGLKDSISHLFFSKRGEKNKEECIKTYLIVCTGIID